MLLLPLQEELLLVMCGQAIAVAGSVGPCLPPPAQLISIVKFYQDGKAVGKESICST